MGKLFLVATPIGNLKDITLRALETLKVADLILCEDTRRTRKLLAHYQIKKPLLSYFEHNEERRIPEVIEKLKQGQKIALVSDAGTPTISDPGFKLVRECINQGIEVESIPGPSAILVALTSSGLPTDKFLFLGYLPRKPQARKKALESLTMILHSIKVTVIFFESPHRLLSSLKDLKEVLGDVEIAVCRELTKVHEEIRREKVSTAIEHFEKVKPKGEFVVLFRLQARSGYGRRSSGTRSER